MRLIDADALKETICNNVYPVQDAVNSRDYGMFWTGGIEKAIDECPTIDPARQGRWIIGNKTSVFDLAGEETWAVRMICSECSFSTNFVEGHNSQYRYCPNCGAEMEGE